MFSYISVGYLVPLLAKEIPEDEESYATVMDDVEKHIMPGMLHWEHQHFYAYFGNGNSYPSVLADMFCAVTGVNGFSWVTTTSSTKSAEFPTIFIKGFMSSNDGVGEDYA